MSFGYSVTTISDGIKRLADLTTPIRANKKKKLSSYSIPPNDYVELTYDNLDGYSAVVVVVRATYDPSATAGVRVRWLYSPDGVNFDSPEDSEAQGNYEDLTFSAGATRQRTVVVSALSDYVKVQIVNRDTTYQAIVDVWDWLLRMG